MRSKEYAKKRRKGKGFFSFFLALFLLLSFPVFAGGEELSFEEELREESGSEKLYEVLDDETKELLSKVGVEGASMPEKTDGWISALSEMLREKLSAPFRGFALLTAIMILCRLASCIDPGKLGDLIFMVGAAACAAVVIVPLLSLMRSVRTVSESASVFLLAAVPVYGGLMAASGSAAAGVSHSFMTLTAGNAIPVLVTAMILPMLQMVLALALVAAISQSRLERFSKLLYSGVKWLLVFSVTVFSGILSIETVLNAQVDAASNKAVKLIASSAVPIVGGAFGDAVAAIQNSVHIVKSGIGAFGILASLCMFAPTAIEISLWICVCSLGELSGELLELPRLSAFLGACASAAKALLAVIASLCAVCIVTAAILIFVKGSL